MLRARPLDALATYRSLAGTDRCRGMSPQEWQAAYDAGQFVGFVAREEEQVAGVLVVELLNVDDIHIHVIEGNEEIRAFLMRQLLTRARDQYLKRLATTGQNRLSC
jgi:hypothetical protein